MWIGRRRNFAKWNVLPHPDERVSHIVIPGASETSELWCAIAHLRIYFSLHSSGTMDSCIWLDVGAAPSAQNSFAILSRRRIPE
jgi:hypothetical protein